MQLKGRHMIAGENSATIMSNLVTQTFYFDRYIDFNEIMRQIERIDIEDLNAIGSEVFKNGLAQAAVSIIGPENSERCRQSCLEQTLNKVQKQFYKSAGGTKWV
jgi:predicted Zn-dependent peptidase